MYQSITKLKQCKIKPQFLEPFISQITSQWFETKIMTCLSQSNKGNFYRQFFKAERCANLLPISFFSTWGKFRKTKTKTNKQSKRTQDFTDDITLYIPLFCCSLISVTFWGTLPSRGLLIEETDFLRFIA